MGCQYPFLAAAVTTLDKIEKIPREFWIEIAIAVLAVIAIYVVLRTVLKINKFVLGGAAFIAAGLIWFNWIYHRNEPRFLTPVMNKIAPFFPAAGAYQTKQAGTPDFSPSQKQKAPTPTPRKR